jgi:putative transposase
MPRANRHIQARGLYHITHRCHDQAFLLRFSRDRQVYRALLREGLARHDVQLLTYCITLNHVHLLFQASSTEELSRLMQYVQGSFAQSYNLRKHRTGAFWSDRYHATMIENGEHLWRCIRYIDLNMIRAGVVRHPRDWDWTGWRELMGQRNRNRLLNMELVVEMVGEKDPSSFRKRYAQSLEEFLQKGPLVREPEWSEAVAVGSECFIAKVEQELLRDYTRKRLEKVTSKNGSMILRESQSSYGSKNRPENRPIVGF